MQPQSSEDRRSLGIRGKLVLIFVVIKVLPLLLLAWLAWSAAERLGGTLTERAEEMAQEALETIRGFAAQASDDAIQALDDRSREALERLTTDTARDIASFLYARDSDILQAALSEPSEAAYARFLKHRERFVFRHGPWRLNAAGDAWEPEHFEGVDTSRMARAEEVLEDNARHFSARPPEYLGRRLMAPLFVEMSFVDLKGRERIKVRTGDLTEPGLRDISIPANTFLGAETYWPEVTRLAPGEIYVSEVIGEYVGSPIIGPYTPARAEKAGIPFEPQKAAYAGTENPVGRRFRAIVRWATPVLEGERIVGYVTLALDHEHLRQFTDRLSPTARRYTDINDAISGNYAFLWDHEGRAISHPRDQFIVGFDRATGLRVPPWLDTELYARWQGSGMEVNAFLASVPPFEGQSLQRKPAVEMIRAGTVGLDCRYLSFSPQCAGWKQLTEGGGSGSFVIFFSGLWKLTTAAAIPYDTGQYGRDNQGFGFVTIGANVDEFHRAATRSTEQIAGSLDRKAAEFAAQREGLVGAIRSHLEQTAAELGVSTALMILAVIGVALWMAAFMTRQITRLSEGIERFRAGDLEHRLAVRSRDEMGELALSLNRMADAVKDSFDRLDEARARAVEANRLKTSFLAKMSHELRTPLNGILGFSELLSLTSPTDQARSYAQTIQSSGNHLLQIVDDLLDMAKIEAGKLEVSPRDIELGDFVGDVCAGHRRHAEQKSLDFVVELASGLPSLMHSDPVRLRQVLNNLLNNAIKFTETGGVTLSVARDARGWICFAVSDTGRGIPADQLDKVFEPFSQVEDFMTRSRDGTGLGLTLVKELTALLQGEVIARSTPEVGSVFTVSFPPAMQAQVQDDPE
ncbi:MAG: HAMP domain-containing protein [Rhodocyclaceae bacterium]|nr:HAMP domain-containing protein [Rhodocyclaceae bacterium]